MNRTVSFAVAMLLFPVLAFAAPATVRVFEAQVHSKPEASAPVVSTLPENTAVSVSEEVEKGWRKIRLPDGSVGYVEDAAVALSQQPAAPTAVAPAAPAPAAPAPAAAPPAPTHAKIYVKDLDHFADLVKSDLEVHERAVSLASRARTGKIVMYGGMAAGTVVAAVGAISVATHVDRCVNASLYDPCTNDKPSAAPVLIGAGLAGVSALVGWMILPSRSSLLDALNLWNTHHPSEPFELEHGHVDH